MKPPAHMESELPIRTVAAMTGVNPITLRAWERRYGLIRPVRTPSGQRLYTARHVELIRRVLALVERGIPIGRAQELLADESQAAAPARGAKAAHDYRERMAAAIARFDEAALDDVYDEAISRHPIERITQTVVLPLLADLGRRWEKVQGAIAEEHFFATYLRSKLGGRFQQRMRYVDGPRLVLACAPGEQHEIGLLLFALEARAAGFRTILLGADTPLEEMAIARRQSGAEAIVISSSEQSWPEPFAKALRKLARESAAPVFVGGPAALRHGAEIAAAGAFALGNELEHGVRFLASRLSGASAR
jgi:DNA-binding transcriptional MerR regulator/methylmalonyl-CoA mutase cobalamin-binding subunit